MGWNRKTISMRFKNNGNSHQEGKGVLFDYNEGFTWKNSIQNKNGSN